MNLFIRSKGPEFPLELIKWKKFLWILKIKSISIKLRRLGYQTFSDLVFLKLNENLLID